MGRKRTHKCPPTRAALGEKGLPVWQQSQQINSQAYFMAYSQMLNIALSRFKWLNLPKTCNAWFLEYNLLYYGYATIAFPHSKPGVFFSTQAVVNSDFNVYYRPKKWTSYGINGWHFDVNNSNGVFIYSSKARTPLVPTLEFFAHEIEDLYMTRRQNRFHQKTPFILEVPAGQQTAGVNVIKQISGGEMAIMATPGFTDSMKAQVLKTGVEYIGMELQNDIQNTWNAFYQALGIKNLPMKMERQTADEINDYGEPTDLRALSELEERRAACDILNTRFSRYLDAPVEVVWNQDNISQNYNYMTNLEALEDNDNGDI